MPHQQMLFSFKRGIIKRRANGVSFVPRLTCKGGSCPLSIETLKEIRDTEKGARELIEKTKKDAEVTLAQTKSKAKDLLASASKESETIRKEIQNNIQKTAADETTALEKEYEEKVATHKQRVATNQNEAIKVVLDSILPKKQ